MAHNNLGYYLFKQGKFAEAETECRKAGRLDPQDANIHDSLGQVLAHTNRDAKAISECRSAVRLAPTAVHLNSLAYALNAGGQREEARRDWQQVIKMDNPVATSEARAMLARHQ